MHILLQDVIKVCDIDMAEQALHKFVLDFERLYGPVNVSFNVHLLIHLTTSVRNWGPLWATSTFPFESFNGTLLRFFNGSTHVPTQIVRRFLRWRNLSKKGEKIMVTASENVKKLFNELQSSSRLTNKSEDFQKHVQGFGCPVKERTSVLQKMAIERFLNVTVQSGLFYKRLISKGVVYHSYNKPHLQKETTQLFSWKMEPSVKS